MTQHNVENGPGCVPHRQRRARIQRSPGGGSGQSQPTRSIHGGGLRFPARPACCAWILAALVVAMPAVAQTSADLMTAREIAKQGIEAYDAEDYAAAETHLRQAYDLVKVPTIGLYWARALEKLGRLVEASEVYRETSILKVEKGRRDQQLKAQADAKAEREQLLPRIPKLRVVVEGVERGDVTFTVDGREVRAVALDVGYAVNPGEHVVVGSVGDAAQKETVELTEGDEQSVTLRFSARANRGRGARRSGPLAGGGPEAEVEAEPSRRWQRPAGYTLVGLGTVGLVVGGISTVDAAKKRDDLEASSNCVGSSCFPAEQSEVDAHNNMLRLARIGWVAGGVLTAGGVTLLLTAPHRPASGRRVTPWVGWGSVGVTGEF